MDCLDEEAFWWWWDGDEFAGVLETFCVLGGTEDLDLVVRSSECLKTFVGLLTVVEGWSHAVDSEVWIGDELW